MINKKNIKEFMVSLWSTYKLFGGVILGVAFTMSPVFIFLKTDNPNWMWLFAITIPVIVTFILRAFHEIWVNL